MQHHFKEKNNQNQSTLNHCDLLPLPKSHSTKLIQTLFTYTKFSEIVSMHKVFISCYMCIRGNLDLRDKLNLRGINQRQVPFIRHLLMHTKFKWNIRGRKKYVLISNCLKTFPHILFQIILCVPIFEPTLSCTLTWLQK